MPRPLALLVPLTLCAALTTPVRTQEPQGAGPDAELRKLVPVFEFLRKRNAQDYAITTPNGIDEAKFLTIGGIEQWVTIRGENRANPVLLVVHGGPGDATNPWGYAGLRSWLKTFTVVQWDQRGAGRTLGRNGPASASSLTIDRLVQDGVALSEGLRASLPTPKIVLVGHSFGSILGVLMAKARPELFHAFVGTGQVADPARSYQVAYAELLAHAERLGEARAIRELKEVGPPPYPDGRGYQVQRRWSNLFEGADAFIASMFGHALSAPNYSMRDINDWLDGQGASAERLVPESSALDAKALTGRFALPVYVIQGDRDFTTPTSLARRFVDSLDAPRKAFVTIDGGHFAAFMKPEAFLQALRARVLPVAAAW